MDISRLLTQLNNTGLQNKDTPLYQLLSQLINQLGSVDKSVTSALDGITNIINNDTNTTNITQVLISGDGDGGGGGDVVPGPPGIQGIQGLTGPAGNSIFLESYEEVESMALPGPQGPAGNTGSTGPAGITVFIENDIENDAIPVPGANGAAGTDGDTLLEEHTASGNTELVFTSWYSSAYDEYKIEIVNIVNGSTAIPRIRFSTDGGATYDSGNNYSWGWQFNYSGGNGSVFGSAATSVQWRDTGTPLSANGSWDGHLRLFNPAGALYKPLLGQIAVLDNIAGLIFFHGGGEFNTNSAVNAFQITMSTGTFNGTVRVYGVKK